MRPVRLRHRSHEIATQPSHFFLERASQTALQLNFRCRVVMHSGPVDDQNKKEKTVWGWRPTITFLYLFLSQSLLRLTSFLFQNKK